MFKKLGVVFLWFLITPLLLSGLVYYLNNQKTANNENLNFTTPIVITEEQSSASTSNNVIEGEVLAIKVIDLRPLIVENFLKNTPLAEYSKNIVDTSDKYNLDYRLIPAIAMKETGGGNTAPKNSFNAWGFENGRTAFSSWEGAIQSVAKTLKERYADRGLVTPEQIMTIYAPPQIYTGGQWAKDINYFFGQMESL